MTVIGFVINPIAGMGGRVGLKGTDGVLEEALARGAVPVASERSLRMLRALLSSPELAGERKNPLVHKWLTCTGSMGEDVLLSTGIPAEDIDVVHSSSDKLTNADDTAAACTVFVKKEVDLIVFCGGDGTARDVFSTADAKVPLLGIPAGVKMHSGVFGITPEGTARILAEFLDGKLTLTDVEIMDLDEGAYRRGEWNLKLFGTVKTPYEPNFIQGSKMMIESASDDEIKSEISGFIKEEMDEAPEVMFILGPGSTLASIGEMLGVQTTLLGVDAVFKGKVVGTDVNEQKLLELLDKHHDARLLVSPIGNQGFVLGRGNHQLSPAVIRRIGLDNIWILTTPAKLARTPVLRADTGDAELDREMAEKKSYRVIIGYRLMRRLAISKVLSDIT